MFEYLENSVDKLLPVGQILTIANKNPSNANKNPTRASLSANEETRHTGMVKKKKKKKKDKI